MKHAISMLIVLASFSVSGTLGMADTLAAPASHEMQIEHNGRMVMPFDLGRTMHMFEPQPDGGVETIVSTDGDPAQVALVRTHLRKEAAAFARGDFSDPARIHGKDMQGLAQLEAGSSRLRVRYATIEHGASIRYFSADPKLIHAIHLWFSAQVKDHGAHAMMH